MKFLFCNVINATLYSPFLLKTVVKLYTTKETARFRITLNLHDSYGYTEERQEQTVLEGINIMKLLKINPHNKTLIDLTYKI
jgi:hypothetical protein